MSKPVHERLQRLQLRDNRLLMAGRHAAELVTIAGGSPCYVYDRDACTETVLALRQAMPEQLSLHYAIKANPMPALVDHMACLLDGLDVASLGEMQVALASGMDVEHISFAGPAKQPVELAAAVAAGITVNVESTLELQRLAGIAVEQGRKARVAIRVNPDFELKTSGMKMGGGPKQFGIDAEAVPGILGALDVDHIEFRGFHIFAGSQNLQAEALIEAHDKTFELAARLANSCSMPVAKVNIGGGLGIPYFPGEPRLQLDAVAANLAVLMAGRGPELAQAEIVMELGRYLVGEAGYYICQVTDIKESRGQRYLMTDGGLHHHLSNSGNFGQVIRKNYPVVLADNIAAEHTDNVEIAGPLCTPLDIVAQRIELPAAAVGDYVVVLQSGAYGATASPQGFLSHPKVRELLL
jgi:diaminopimelate decarboxylase